MHTCVCEIILHRYIYLSLYICQLNESIKCVPLPSSTHTPVTQAVERVTLNGLERHRAVDLDVTASFFRPVVDPLAPAGVSLLAGPFKARPPSSTVPLSATPCKEMAAPSLLFNTVIIVLQSSALIIVYKYCVFMGSRSAFAFCDWILCLVRGGWRWGWNLPSPYLG